MTMTMKVLRIMADGKPRTSIELMAESGLNRRHVANTLRNLTRYELVANEPVRYAITPAGVERSKFRPLTQAEHLKNFRKRLREQGKAAKQAEKVKAHKAAERVVSRAKAWRDPLSMAWGSVVSESACA